MKKHKFDAITIGSAVRDIMFIVPNGIIANMNNNGKKIMAFDYGAKYSIEDVNITTGGGACNTAVNLSKLGLKVAVFCVVGEDSDGDAIIQNLKKEKVNLTYLKKSNTKHTAFSTILTLPDSNSKEHIIFHHDELSKDFEVEESDLEHAMPNIFYLCGVHSKKWKNIVKRIISCKKRLKKFNVNTIFSWNPGQTQLKEPQFIVEFLKFVDILILNKREAEILCKGLGFENLSIKEMMQKIKEFGCCVSIITDGINGSNAYDGKNYFYEPIFKNVKTLDTTGVGDAFGSTFTFAYLKFDFDIQKALKAGAINSAFVSSQIGAQNGALNFNALHKLLK